MYPIKMNPDYKELIWGGTRLKTLFHKPIPSDKTGESWEVACHKNGKSTAANGAFAGMTLSDIIAQQGLPFLGTQFTDKDLATFPLLIKFIDATDRLSVQVHPDDAYAMEHEGEPGKTEMWYVIHAEPDAKLIYGVKEGVTHEAFAAAIQDGTLGELLNFVPVQAGDAFFMPATTLHAICEGLVIAEIQQNSDTTYRVFDWNRVGKDGKPRELHVQKALDVTDLTPKTGKEKVVGLVRSVGQNCCTTLVHCPYFVTEKWDILSDASQGMDGSHFEILIILDGTGFIEGGGTAVPFVPGDTFFLPANLGQYTVNGACALLKTYVPDKQTEIAGDAK